MKLLLIIAINLILYIEIQSYLLNNKIYNKLNNRIHHKSNIQSLYSINDDNSSKQPNKNKLIQFFNPLIKKTKTLLAVLAISMSMSLPSYAKKDSSSSKSSGSTKVQTKKKTTTNNKINKSNTIVKEKTTPIKTTKQPTKTSPSNDKKTIAPTTITDSNKSSIKSNIEIIIKKLSNAVDSKEKLNNIGIGLVAVTVLGTLFSNSKSDNNNNKNSKDSNNNTNNKIDYDEELLNKIQNRNKLNYNKQSTSKLRQLPKQEELFPDEKSIDLTVDSSNNPLDNLVDKSSDKLKNQKSIQLPSKEEKLIKEDKNIDSLLESIPEQLDTNTNKVVNNKPNNQKSFFDRIFKKSTTVRPTDLSSALLTSADSSHDFRKTIVGNLMSYLPNDIINEWKQYESIASAKNEEDQLVLLNGSKVKCGLTIQEAADSFADVANAMLVTLVDQAASFYDKKDDDNLAKSLDVISDFILGAGSLFTNALSEASIDPVIYNGKTKKNKLEDIYYKYAKVCYTMNDILSLSDNESNPSSNRIDNLNRIQQVFDIKESKRNNIDQKVLREQMMNMTKDNNFDMGNMIDILSGKGDVNIDEILKGTIDPNTIDPNIAKDIGNLKPDEIASLTKDAMSEVKRSLEEGTVTKEDVEALEKQMGINIKEFVKMIDITKGDKSKLSELGPDIVEMLDIFKKLADVKK